MSRISQDSLEERRSGMHAAHNPTYRVFESRDGELVEFVPEHEHLSDGPHQTVYDQAVASLGKVQADRVAETVRAAYNRGFDR